MKKWGMVLIGLCAAVNLTVGGLYGSGVNWLSAGFSIGVLFMMVLDDLS